jgi:asparagine synthase (glutamine-hydrolysing)
MRLVFSALSSFRPFLRWQRTLGNLYKPFLFRLYHAEGARLVGRVRTQRLSYLGAGALVDLYERVRAIEAAALPGLLIETGTALGGSALVLAGAKSPQRRLCLYDVFGLIPPPSPKDGSDVHQHYQQIVAGQVSGIGGDRYYGYEANLLGKVQQTFSDFGLDPAQNHIDFFAGLYQDTLQIDQPVALAHIDCDWYESVWVCLERIVPQLVTGGILVIDDYYDWSGCRLAVDDYFRQRRAEFQFVTRSRLHIIRR